MGLIGDALQWLFDFAVHLLSTAGLWGLFLLMVAESMFLPVPSEAVMPFAGVLAARGVGQFSHLTVLLVSTAGSLVGSYVGYAMGRFGLLPLVERYGRYVFVQPHHIKLAQAYFERRGTWAVFLCRFIPGVRHISSIPAGAARMRHVPFALATVAGAALWNMFLYWVGYRYGESVMHRLKPYLDVVGIVLLVLVVAYITYELRKGRAARQPPPN
ncbi:MAG TPA: DedA family protein [Candidatus Thermoplasmatota archaeon]|nr:DedA family protein [Candidatus Thermoplasmatota archaeon]